MSLPQRSLSSHILLQLQKASPRDHNGAETQMGRRKWLLEEQSASDEGTSGKSWEMGTFGHEDTQEVIQRAGMERAQRDD